MFRFIKLGGSVITDKALYKSIKVNAIEQITDEIKNYTPGISETLWVFHGAGSFGHHSAKKLLGLSPELQTSSMAEAVQAEVAELSEIVSGYLPGYQILHPHSIWSEDTAWQGLINTRDRMIMHGDMLWENNKARVVSTEDILVRLCGMIEEPIEVLLLCDTDGVYDESGEIIPEIYEEIKTQEKTHPDVTGGMNQKIREGLAMVHDGAKVWIANGNTPGIVTRWLAGEEIEGTQLVVDAV